MQAALSFFVAMAVKLGYCEISEKFQRMPKMIKLKTAVYLGLALTFFAAEAQSAPQPSISERAAYLVKKNKKKQELEKNALKTGQKVDQLGNLSIEDFLMLKPVPEGLDVSASANMADESKFYQSMSTDDAIAAVHIMRTQGIEMPKDLEKKMKKDPENASKLMQDAMKSIKPLDIKTTQDVAKYRRDAIRKAEDATGIDFRLLLGKQKKQMYNEDFQQ